MQNEAVLIGLGKTRLKQKMDLYFAGIGQGLNSHALQRARLPQIIQLELKSDRELAHMGLGRDDILPFVFRDLLSAH